MISTLRSMTKSFLRNQVMQKTPVPMRFWNSCIAYMLKVNNCLPRTDPEHAGKSPLELSTGKLPPVDLMCRLGFWSYVIASPKQNAHGSEQTKHHFYDTNVSGFIVDVDILGTSRTCVVRTLEGRELVVDVSNVKAVPCPDVVKMKLQHMVDEDLCTFRNTLRKPPGDTAVVDMIEIFQQLQSELPEFVSTMHRKALRHSPVAETRSVGPTSEKSAWFNSLKNNLRLHHERRHKETPKQICPPLPSDPLHLQVLYHKYALASFRKALRKYGHEKVEEAMLIELLGILETGTWDLVDPQDVSTAQRQSAIHAITRFDEKFDSKGFFEKLKARLCADGSRQIIEGETWQHPTASPTIHQPHLFLNMAIGCLERMNFAAFDVRNAFLHAWLDEGTDRYLWLPPEIVQVLAKIDPKYSKLSTHSGRALVKLNKALYGLKESPVLWFLTIRQMFMDNGFSASRAEPCTFIKQVGKRKIVVSLFVDDLLVQGTDDELDYVHNLLTNMFHHIKRSVVESLTSAEYIYPKIDLRVS